MLKLAILALTLTLCHCNIDSATNRLFLLKDEDRDGAISDSELHHYLKGCDTNDDNRVSEVEFFHCSTARNHDMHPYAVSLFHAFDVGHQRYISLSDNTVTMILNAFDADANGSITKAEFETYLRHRLHGHHGN